jgi:hypothetical protein
VLLAQLTQLGLGTGRLVQGCVTQIPAAVKMQRSTLRKQTCVNKTCSNSWLSEQRHQSAAPEQTPLPLCRFVCLLPYSLQVRRCDLLQAPYLALPSRLILQQRHARTGKNAKHASLTESALNVNHTLQACSWVMQAP